MPEVYCHLFHSRVAMKIILKVPNFKHGARIIFVRMQTSQRKMKMLKTQGGRGEREAGLELHKRT